MRHYYTIEPKRHAYPEETRELAIKMYYGGVSGRSVGKILGMNKSNVVNWIKKANQGKAEEVSTHGAKIVRLDELYWYLKYKPRTRTRENVYIMTMVSRKPRQILGHVASRDKMSRMIQRMVDTAPEAKYYRTDGYFGYLDVIFPGKHIYNIQQK